MALIWGLLFLGAFRTVAVRWWVALESEAGSAGLDIRNGSCSWQSMLREGQRRTGPVNQETWVWSLHMAILFPARWLVSKETPKRNQSVSQHREAQEEATASYNPTSEVLECRFLLLLVKWVIKAQPGFTGRE